MVSEQDVVHILLLKKLTLGNLPKGEGDIKSYFDTIDHHKLISLIEIRVKDQEFRDLIWKAIRAGYMEVKKSKKTDALV
jgi:retron-type reverse transcriptase